jgi:teichoic acid transport system permease protein
MFFVNIIVGTPIWVWILFSVLIVNGISALNDREMEIQHLFVMPLFFLPVAL